MQDDISATFRKPNPSDVCVVDGHGVRITVSRGHLRISDGVGRSRRERSYWRGDPGFSRLVMLAGDGYVTINALRWLSDLGIAFAHIDAAGKVIFTSTSTHLNDAHLRRRQAAAPETSDGIEIARHLLSLKLRGQLRVARRIDVDSAKELLARAIRQVEEATSLEEMLVGESQGAAAYWQAWSQVPIRFANKDRLKIPDYWLTFGTRRSPITNGSRLAANPINAILNYLYALLEAETHIALRLVGLDPGLGIVHTDQGSRDSLALDVMEAVRPHVDECVYELCATRTFRARDFHETTTGVCRILPPLTHLLAETSSHWAELVAPIAEQIASTLREGTPTPLTQRNRSVGRGKNSRYSLKHPTPRIPGACRQCGELTGDSSPLCAACLAEVGADRVFPDVNRSTHHSGDASIRRGNAISSRWDELKTWSKANPDPPDRSIFQKEIWPQLRHMTITRLVNATGLSPRYCQLIRQGKTVPHPRHWENLRRLT